jgi:protease-4
MLKQTVRWSQLLLLGAFALLFLPLKRLARKRALVGRGWVELDVAGEITDMRREDRVQEVLLRRALRQPEPRRVVLERLVTLVDELLEDPNARGVLVRLGPLTGGWASAESVRRQLVRLRDGGKYVLVHAERALGNRELLVATGGSRVLVPPTGLIAAGGTAAPGLFLKGLLDKLGLTFEVASAGRFKSAPDQFTRKERSEADLEQTKAIVDALDEALVDALRTGRGLTDEKAKAFLQEAPIVGRRAKELGYVDGLALDESLLEEVSAADGLDRKLPPLGAGRYLQLRRPPKPWRRVERHVGVVRVVGNIVDEAPPQGLGPSAEAAVEKRVVADLRAALRDPNVASVVLLVDSRGGSVTASDAIWAAVRRLRHDKPVVAYFADVSASGGYYVACGAQAIVCSPLTITGSIGVFSVLPTWPELTRRLDIGHDVVKNLENADLYNPWEGFDDARRAHAQREVEVMYDAFLDRVVEARGMTRDQVHDVAQGRVWMGKDAHAAGLVDGLGGFPEAVDRARHLAKGSVSERPQVVKARRPQSRPRPARHEGAVSPADLLRRMTFSPGQAALVDALLGSGAEAQLLRELALLWATRSPRGPSTFAWAPVGID